MNILKKILLITSMGVTAISITACSPQGNTAPSTTVSQTTVARTMKVQSTEKVSVVPDIANIDFSVSTQADDAKACQQENSDQLNKVIDFLKKSGIDEKSIQTSNYDLQPIYDWKADQKITGYEMNTALTVSNVPIEKVGGLLSSSVSAGINNIENVNYMYSQYDKSYQEALNKAIESSKTKAQSMAETCGCTLGKVLNLEELSNNSDAGVLNYKTLGATQETDSMALEPGQINIEAQILVTYQIQ